MKSTTKSILAGILVIVLSATAFGAAIPPPDQPVLIDTSASAGSVVASSSSSATYAAANAFDGNWSDNAGRWLAYNNPNNDYGNGVHGESPMYLVYQFNTPTKVNVLRLRIQNANEWDKRSPKAWTFLGSNDGTTWTTLDSRSGVAWASGTTVKTFAFENETKYAYYKFNCTEIVGSNNYMQLYEIQFLYDSGIVLTDLTTPSGTVTTTTAGDWVKPAKNAFDNGTAHNNDDRSIHSGTTVDWIYTFDTPTKVNAYKVHVPGSAAYNYDKRMPKTWTFEAKNAEDATWTILDTQASETGWTALESRYYEFQNNTAYDSYRFAVTAVQSGSDSYVQIDELEFFFINRGGPAIGNLSLVRTGALAYSLVAEEDANAADLSCLLDDGTTITTNGTQAVAEAGSATWPISGLTSNKTWQVSVLAENAAGTDEKVAGTLFTGELTLGATTDANEYGLVAGGVTASRAAADPFPLTVNYTISGSVGSQGTTWAVPDPVIIPANATSAVLPVIPIVDASVTEDVTITVTLVAGNYEMPAVTSATLMLANLVAPAGYNVWVAAADGLASDDANWSSGHAPTSSENVLFHGDFSTANCEWDADATDTVASWTQTNGYTGTVTVDTVFPEKGAFTVLTVTGDMAISAGTVTHKSHTSTYKVDQYRLRIDVGGDLTVASGANISARAKGSYGPRSTGESAYGGSYNGNLSWGSLTEPYGVGSSANDNGTYTCFGGGAIWIEVDGDTLLDGAINANGIETKGMWDTHAGSGGAVYLKTATLSGSGTISANCESTGRGSNNRTAAGGRVSVLLTAGELSSFPDANITALAGNTSYANVGGVGTVLVRTPLKPNGILYLRDRSGKYGQYGYRPKPNQLTRIPAGQTWVVDGIVFGENAILQVPTGTTLDLRGGLAAVTSTGNTLDETGLIVDGGTLLLPSAATHTISGKWIFEPKDYTLAGNLVVTNGAGVGTMLLYSTTSNEVRTCGLSVSGDMHVSSGSYLRAVRGGYIATGAETPGGTLASCHGGTRAATTTASRSYDSFFHPRHPGAFGVDNGLINVGGGAIRLAVSGTLTLDGVAIATPSVNNARCGAAGSIDITAARLEGAGRIEANGNSRNYQAADSSSAGGGGRVAVRLTGAGEIFSNSWVSKINAKGYYSSKITAAFSSSAGSVYLQTGSQSEGAGTIIIRNTGDAANNVAVTELPSLKGGGEEDDFRKASLSVEAAARVQLFADLRMAELIMATGTALDLNGHAYTVQAARVAGEKVAPGTYTAAQMQASGLDEVVDTADGAGGTLRVLGAATLLLMQ